MSTQSVYVTGLGVIAPNGIGDRFMENCRSKVSGIRPIQVFDTSTISCKVGGEVSEFKPMDYLGGGGLRNLDRTALLALAAAKLAIDDAELEITSENANRIGVVMGSTMGSVRSISQFDISGLRDGPRFVNPGLFPNTVINSAASRISIRFGITGLNATVSTGFTASLAAVEYAVDMIRLGRADVILAGGAEELCWETCTAFQELGLAFRSSDGNGGNRGAEKQDRQETQTLIGEGAGFLVLESKENVSASKRSTYAELLSAVTSYDPEFRHRFPLSGTALEAVIRRALEQANVQADEVSVLATWTDLADGSSESLIERSAVESALGTSVEKLEIQSIRPLIGECFSAMGVFQSIAAIGMLRACERPSTVLVSTMSFNGSYAASILRTQ